MAFNKGDIVRFKTGAPQQMLVINPNKKRSIGSGQRIIVIECKWYEPMSPKADDHGFLVAAFEDFEIEKV